MEASFRQYSELREDFKYTAMFKEEDVCLCHDSHTLNSGEA